VRVRTYGFPGCLTRPPGTSTRHHHHEPTASKPVVPGGVLCFQCSAGQAPGPRSGPPEHRRWACAQAAGPHGRGPGAKEGPAGHELATGPGPRSGRRRGRVGEGDRREAPSGIASARSASAKHGRETKRRGPGPLEEPALSGPKAFLCGRRGLTPRWPRSLRLGSASRFNLARSSLARKPAAINSPHLPQKTPPRRPPTCWPRPRRPTARPPGNGPDGPSPCAMRAGTRTAVRRPLSVLPQ